MVSWINRRKRLIQWAVVVLGLLLLVPSLYRIYPNGLSGSLGEKAFKGLSKPAEVGIYALVALLAVRLTLRYEWVRAKARVLFRLLQVIHVPLGLVVFASAALHGLGFLFLNWHNDFHSWSGAVALSLMVTTVLFGLRTIKRPGRKAVHLILGLITFAAVIGHIFLPGGEEPGERKEHDRRPPRAGAYQGAGPGKEG